VTVGPVNHLPTDYEVQFELSSTDSTRVEQFVRAFAATLVRSSVDA
jgi:hypothetical protein